MDMPQPTEAHRELARFAGTWTGDEVVHPSPWDPEGSTYQARSTNRVALGGFVVIGDYEQSKDGHVTFLGHAVYTYDPSQQCIVLYWWDSMGLQPNLFKGNFEGDRLTLICEQNFPDDEGAGPQYSRLTHEFSQPGTLTTRMEMSEDGKTWKNFMDGSYTKEDG